VLPKLIQCRLIVDSPSIMKQHSRSGMGCRHKPGMSQAGALLVFCRLSTQSKSANIITTGPGSTLTVRNCSSVSSGTSMLGAGCCCCCCCCGCCWLTRAFGQSGETKLIHSRSLMEPAAGASGHRVVRTGGGLRCYSVCHDCARSGVAQRTLLRHQSKQPIPPYYSSDTQLSAQLLNSLAAFRCSAHSISAMFCQV
jgi:hypothetical protein